MYVNSVTIRTKKKATSTSWFNKSVFITQRSEVSLILWSVEVKSVCCSKALWPGELTALKGAPQAATKLTFGLSCWPTCMCRSCHVMHSTDTLNPPAVLLFSSLWECRVFFLHRQTKLPRTRLQFPQIPGPVAACAASSYMLGKSTPLARAAPVPGLNAEGTAFVKTALWCGKFVR